ncbi:Protein kinase domain and Serine/threonine-/dual specificity protein kinase, catalytic domain and Protein kinase-like domain-containing protein [Strongyloides ratti]|uniref:calcium/calmodulin-dependent protein kinase n=1 Tax=Strongyloides ratti TaxID=34506 RepID=A0A090LD64_STRRB|nr:Protein kinase domain and Serine/threonine-/dual specificity protein kinase, catalytic domain and Protein kinase-like domain-containing protein [Strongyloides ratti]CEF65470.1 Protein kinase domain and Serine/threonine-/dual specificity protein kinase, catalytic domain and Protein kinase-like domain-containing protein [Strongyloides ratti]
MESSSNLSPEIVVGKKSLEIKEGELQNNSIDKDIKIIPETCLNSNENSMQKNYSEDDEDSKDFLSTNSCYFIRQSSDTSYNNRKLTRSEALDDEICDYERPTSCNLYSGISNNNKKNFEMSSYINQHTKIFKNINTSSNYVQLNQYKLIEDIGQGSYGIVKLAYNEKDEKHYAMKVLDKMKLLKKFACFRPLPTRRSKSSPSTKANPLQLVQREIAILKKLSHPNIVKLVEALDDPEDKFIYIIFELVEKGSIIEIPTDKPLSENKAWKYFRDTLSGLEYLHYQKIVHRDIKPSNLLLSETGQVKIADFGVSCEFEGIDAFLTGTAGAPAFMAPEALIEDASHFYSGRAQDIWSLGITLFCFVFGKVPFWDDFIIALHKKIKTQSLEIPNEPIISDTLKDLLHGILKKDPGHRLMLVEIKNHPWVTKDGKYLMLSEEENCHLVTVTEEEIKNCVRIIPRLDTLILIKSMGHRKRFGNPFRSSSKSRTITNRKCRSVRDTNYSSIGCKNIENGIKLHGSLSDRPELSKESQSIDISDNNSLDKKIKEISLN